MKKCRAIYTLMTEPDFTYDKICELCDCSRNSLRNWVNEINSGSICRFLSEHMYKRQSVMMIKRDEIDAKIEEVAPPNAQYVRELLAKDFQIDRSLTQVRHFLHQCGYKFIRMGHVPGKADPEAQETWLKEMEETVFPQVNDGKAHLLFSDACHFVLGAFVTNAWCKTRKFLKSGAGRNRINVLGSVDATSKDFTHIENTTYIDANVVKDLLKKIREKYGPGEKIYMVMDNARYQHCQAVEDYAKSPEINIQIIFLPSYSPNLNIIERVWRFAKKTILYGKYFPTVKEFHETIRSFFSELNCKYQKNLESLLTLNFQRF